MKDVCSNVSLRCELGISISITNVFLSLKMNFLIYKQLRTLKEMSSRLFIHQFLSCKGKTWSGKAPIRCCASAIAHPKRKRKPSRKTFVPAIIPEEESEDVKTKLMTDEELDEMYEKKFYNSDMWRAVIERQKAKFKMAMRPKIDPSRATSKKSDEVLSYAAQTVLEDSGWWRGELSMKTLVEPDALLELEAMLLPKGQTRYPFAMVKPANEVSEPMQNLLAEGVTTEHSYAEPEPEPPSGSDEVTVSLLELEETLRDLQECAAEEAPLNELSLLNPNYIERIELTTPYQQYVGPQEVQQIQANRLKALYGSPNPDVPSTNMPCGGCGAILHCQDSAIPGYLPSEMLENLTFLELQDTICQRCNFLKNYDVALNVSVAPNDYVRVISEIQDKKALVILLVDLLDFPCSIWPGIIDLIGPNRPIVVVGNKVDLLPKDDRGYLDRIKMCLEQSLKDFGVDTGNNIKHLALISAKTGYGIEELITSIQHHWGIKGDVYVVGCTNVGKSSLFNALLQSDLCKSQAVDLVQRATVSTWPGTTLKLLKFPLLNPTPWRTYLRVQRLKAASREYIQERMLRKQRLMETNNPVYATLIGNIGMTFKTDPLQESIAAAADPFKMSHTVAADLSTRRRKKFKEDDPAFVDGKWFYDTPGAVHHHQIINLLTLEELANTIPKTLLSPRCVVVKPGQTFFLAGLGRIDYIEGETSASFMLFSSNKLPVSVVYTEFADEFYQKYLGTKVLTVPFGGWDRLKDFPALKPKEVTFFSDNKKECCGDIVLSSAGWVSVNFSQKSNISGTFLAYTPEGRGCYVRQPSLLRYSIGLRGKRIAMTPFCKPSQVVE